MKIALLGGSGLIGRVTARELQALGIDFAVMDIVKPEYNVEYEFLDLNDIEMTSSKVKNYDYVINAAQYYFNLNVMKACLKSGVNYVDLGGLFWMTKKQLELHKDFEKEGLLAVIGMGAEPGITNVIAEWIYEKHGIPERIKLRDGWISTTDNINWSIDTQLDEMTMDAPIFDGELKYYKPLSKSDEVDFSIGKIKTYLTIHSELATFPSSFPGVKYVDWMEGGTGFENIIFIGKLFGDNDEILGIKSRKYLRELLKKKGLLGYSSIPDEVEAAKVIFEYEKKIESVEFVAKPMGLFDGTQYVTGISPAIAISVGIKGEGVLPPEKVISSEKFIEELKKRKIDLYYAVNEKL